MKNISNEFNDLGTPRNRIDKSIDNIKDIRIKIHKKEIENIFFNNYSPRNDYRKDISNTYKKFQYLKDNFNNKSLNMITENDYSYQNINLNSPLHISKHFTENNRIIYSDPKIVKFSTPKIKNLIKNKALILMKDEKCGTSIYEKIKEDLPKKSETDRYQNDELEYKYFYNYYIHNSLNDKNKMIIQSPKLPIIPNRKETITNENIIDSYNNRKYNHNLHLRNKFLNYQKIFKHQKEFNIK